MTGQVKEDVLSRFGELGVFVEGGKLLFNPRLLRIGEFLKESKVFKYTDINKEVKEIELEKNSLCFTYCQIPIIYKLGEKKGLKVVLNDGSNVEFKGLNLDSEMSKKVFERTGEINLISVFLAK